jgi:hypothetical protein
VGGCQSDGAALARYVDIFGPTRALLKGIGALLDFVRSRSGVVLTYRPDERQSHNNWAWNALLQHDSVTLSSRVFTFKRRDLVSKPDAADAEDDFEAFTYQFNFAVRQEGYFQIEGRIFDIPNKVLIADAGLPLSRRLLVAERNISIMSRIATLLPPDHDIVIGGDRPENIPIPVFEELLRKFPNTAEMNHYAAARGDQRRRRLFRPNEGRARSI